MKCSTLQVKGFRSAGSFLLIFVMFLTGRGAENEPIPGNSPAAAAIVSSERNLTTDQGEFNVVLRRSPSDPRTGETVQFLVRLAEKVEGGFGGDEPVLLEKASVKAKITKAGGAVDAESLATTAEPDGNYRMAYVFPSSGDFKIVFAVTTADNRSFTIDFPVSVASGPIRASFWIGMLILSLLALGSFGAIVFAAKRRGTTAIKQTAPLFAAAMLIFGLGTAALVLLLPPRQSRTIAEISPNASVPAAANQLETKTVLTVPKESQILFGIKTEPIAGRQIAGGVKTSGTVRARPDATAVVVPQVAGKIVLREGITLGSAVGRGEQIGYVEQVLDVSGQTALESQRLDVEAQQRDVEAKRLEVKNTILELQLRQSDQRAKASQAKTQLAQAQRELRRSENLVEAGAVPRKRLEEAQTAVKVAGDEVSAAEQQIRLLGNQIKQNSASTDVFRSSRVIKPNRTFPLVAPISGIINEIKTTSGQNVETGTEILSISNLSTVLLEAQVFENDLPEIRESTRASFTAAALSGEVYSIGTADGDGRLVSIGQTVNEQTRTVAVFYEVKNPANKLREGMFVEITVDTGRNETVLAVPKNAVVTDQGKSYVFVFDGGESFEKRPVVLGQEGAEFYEIRSGLKEGERVVTDGIYQLRSSQSD